jgi:hypothetical protein
MSVSTQEQCISLLPPAFRMPSHSPRRPRAWRPASTDTKTRPASRPAEPRCACSSAARHLLPLAVAQRTLVACTTGLMEEWSKLVSVAPAEEAPLGKQRGGRGSSSSSRAARPICVSAAKGGRAAAKGEPAAGAEAGRKPFAYCLGAAAGSSSATPQTVSQDVQLVMSGNFLCRAYYCFQPCTQDVVLSQGPAGASSSAAPSAAVPAMSAPVPKVASPRSLLRTCACLWCEAEHC